MGATERDAFTRSRCLADIGCVNVRAVGELPQRIAAERASAAGVIIGALITVVRQLAVEGAPDVVPIETRDDALVAEVRQPFAAAIQIEGVLIWKEAAQLLQVVQGDERLVGVDTFVVVDENAAVAKAARIPECNVARGVSPSP